MATKAKTLKKQDADIPLPAWAWALASALTVIGLAAWIYQLSAGMEVTGLGQQVVWGAYIAAFFTAVGAGAGLLALVGINEFRPVFSAALRRSVLALALACFVASGMLIMMDLGNPAKIFVMVTAFRLNSMMTWDFWLLVLAGIVTLVYLWQTRPNTALGALSVLAAVMVVVTEGWMLASLAARPMWGGGLMVINFLVGAAIAGLGLLALLPVEAAKMRAWLTWALSAGLLLVLAETLTGLVSRDPQVSDEMRILLFGSGASVFWLHTIIGLIVPLLLARMPSGLTAAAALAVVGVLAEKIWVLAVGQAAPWVELPAGSYLPSWVELAAVIGMAGLAALIFLVLKKFVLGKLAR